MDVLKIIKTLLSMGELVMELRDLSAPLFSPGTKMSFEKIGTMVRHNHKKKINYQSTNSSVTFPRILLQIRAIATIKSTAQIRNHITTFNTRIRHNGIPR